jgi:iron complex transport system substrate-binding protein
VSINLCADQLVVELAQRRHIASVSNVALDPTVSNVVARARGLVTNSGRLEEIVRLKPDLVVSTRHRESRMNTLLRRFGVAVMELPAVDSIAEAYQLVRELASRLGEAERGARLIAEMQAGFAAVADQRPVRQLVAEPGATPVSEAVLAVVYRPNGYTSGRQTFVHDVMVQAGLSNLAAQRGIERWGTIPLEVLMYAQPAIVVLDDSVGARTSLAHRSLGHPALRMLRPRWHTLSFPSRLWVCPGPWLVQAAEYLLAARQQLSSRRVAAPDVGAPTSNRHAVQTGR